MLVCLPSSSLTAVTPAALMEQIQAEAEAKAVLEQTHRACTHMYTFQEQVAERRAEITANFEQLRQAVDASERDALQSFDGVATHVWKFLEVQLEALNVKGCQISARIKAGLRLDDFLAEVSHDQPVTPAVSIPIFNDEGLCVIRNALRSGKCWSFFLETNTAAQEQCQVLREMRHFIIEAETTLGNDILRKSVGFMNKHAPEFQCKHLTTICMDIQAPNYASAFVVSPDGSMCSFISQRTVHLVSLLTGTVIRSFDGPGFPCALCFTACGENILMANAANSEGRIREIAVSSGECVRFLGEESAYGLVDVNSEVVVAWKRADASIEVYDYLTGKFTANVGHEATYCALKLTPDGSGVACALSGGQCVNIFALHGTRELTQTIGLSIFPRQIAFVSPTRLVVTSTDPLSVIMYSLTDSTQEKFLIASNLRTSFVAMKRVYCACANGFLWIPHGKNVHVFW